MALPKNALTAILMVLLAPVFFIPAQEAQAADAAGMCVCAVSEPNPGSEFGDFITYGRCLKEVTDATTCGTKSAPLTSCFFFTGAYCNVDDWYLTASDNKMLIKTIVPCVADTGCNPAKADGGEGLCRDKMCWMNEPAFNKWRASSNPDQVALTTVAQDLGIRKPLLELHIPGLSFTDVQNTLDNEGYIHLPYIGELIAALYKLGMVVGSIVAAVMIIMNGARIILSAGGEGKIEGYKRIGGIVVGLVIMWGSYALLYNINPDLVSFKAIKIKYIEKKDLDGSEAGAEKPTGTAGECGGVAGHQQTLANDLSLSGGVFPFARYSSKFGDTCKRPVTIKGIVLHYTVTDSTASARGVVKDWSSSQSPGSICQIIVDKDGQAYQVTEKLEEHVICQGGSSGFNLNDGGIGIEIMGMNETELLANTKQKQAVIELVKKLTAKYGIEKTNKVSNLLDPGSGNGIFSHRQVTHCEGAPHQKDDPGETYTQQIIEGVGGSYTNWQIDSHCNKQ